MEINTSKLKINGFIWLLIVLVFIFSSCSLQKRHYTNGFYVENNLSGKKTDKRYGEDTLPSVLKAAKPLKGKRSSAVLSVQAPNKKTNAMYVNPPSFKTIDGCDTLILRDGTVILSYIKEIYPTEIKYKYCDEIDGPLRTINKADVKSIIYSNGLKEEIPSVSSLITYKVDPSKDYQRDYYSKRRNAGKKNPFIMPGLIPNFATYPIAAILLASYGASSFFTGSLSNYINSSLGGNSFNIVGSPGTRSSTSPLLIIGLVFTIAALIFSSIAIYQILTNKEGNRKGLGLAIAGAILSLLMLVFMIMVILGLI